MEPTDSCRSVSDSPGSPGWVVPLILLAGPPLGRQGRGAGYVATAASLAGLCSAGGRSAPGSMSIRSAPQRRTRRGREVAAHGPAAEHALSVIPPITDDW